MKIHILCFFLCWHSNNEVLQLNNIMYAHKCIADLWCSYMNIKKMQFMAIVFNIQLHTYGPKNKNVIRKTTTHRPVNTQRKVSSIYVCNM